MGERVLRLPVRSDTPCVCVQEVSDRETPVPVELLASDEYQAQGALALPKDDYLAYLVKSVPSDVEGAPKWKLIDECVPPQIQPAARSLARRCYAVARAERMAGCACGSHGGGYLTGSHWKPPRPPTCELSRVYTTCILQGGVSAAPHGLAGV